MARKKFSPLNPSNDEGYVEEILSDSSLESNSRRNVRRKKPKRKNSSKENIINSHLQKETQQGHSLKKNEKRPAIIKIFRRIDRRAKNIYLVDDKIEDRNEVITSPPEPKGNLNVSNEKKGLRLFNLFTDEKPLCNRYTGKRSAKMSKENSNTITQTDCSKDNDAEEVDVWNLSRNLEISSSSESEVDVWNLSRDLEVSSSSESETDIKENIPCDLNASFSGVADCNPASNNTDVWNTHRDVDSLYPSVTDIDQTPNRSYDWHLKLDSYSDISDGPEGGDGQRSTVTDVDIQQFSTYRISTESDSLQRFHGEPSNAADVYNSKIDYSGTDSYKIPIESDSLKMGDNQSSTAADVDNLQFHSYSDASMTGSCAISAESNYSGKDNLPSDGCIQQFYSDIDDSGTCSGGISTDSSEGGDGRVSPKADVYNQQFHSYSDASMAGTYAISTESNYLGKDNLLSDTADGCIQQFYSDIDSGICSGGISTDSSEGGDGQVSPKADVYFQQSSSLSDASMIDRWLTF